MRPALPLEKNPLWKTRDILLHKILTVPSPYESQGRHSFLVNIFGMVILLIQFGGLFRERAYSSTDWLNICLTIGFEKKT